MTQMEHLSKVLGPLYDSVLDPCYLHHFAEYLAQAVNAKSAIVRLVDVKRARTRFSARYNFDPSFDEAYGSHFIKQDPVLETLRELPDNNIYIANDKMDYSALKHTEYFNDFMTPQDTFHMIGGIAAINHDQHIFIGAQRTAQQAPFDETQRRFLQSLVPHIQRSAKLSEHLQKAATQNQIIEQMNIGVLCLDASGHVLPLNTVAEQLLARDSRLSMRNGQLFTRHSHEQDKLQHLLQQATDSLKHPETPWTQAVSLAATQVGQDDLYIIAMTHSHNSHLHIAFNRPKAILLVGTINSEQGVNTDLIQSIYGLTPSEAKLAQALCQGVSINDYCDEHGISQNTGRTHLKAIFMKLDVSSQAGLVAKLLRCPYPDSGQY